MPLVGGIGKYKRRRVMFRDNPDNGWYRVALGNTPTIISKATPTQVDMTLGAMPSLMVYAFGEEGIPVNFDNFRKIGCNESVKIESLNLPIFEVAKVVRWYDQRFYFYEPDTKFQRTLLRAIQHDFELEKPLQINSYKDVTPELSYYYFLLNLERQTYRELERFNNLKLAEAERQKRLKQFKNTFEGRLKEAIGKAGGTFVSLSKANADSYLVTWKTMGQTVKTTIRDNLQVLSAGFCVSGDDRRHSIASLIQLAKVFQRDEGRDLYITRE